MDARAGRSIPGQRETTGVEGMRASLPWVSRARSYAIARLPAAIAASRRARRATPAGLLKAIRIMVRSRLRQRPWVRGLATRGPPDWRLVTAARFELGSFITESLHHANTLTLDD